MRSIPDNLDFAISLDKVARTDGTVNGTTVDTGRDHFQRMAKLDAGLYVDGVHTFTFEDSPDDSVFTALAAEKLDDPAGLLAGAAIVIDDVAEDNVIIEIGLLTTERYVRAKQVTTGSTTGLIAGVTIASGAKRHAGLKGQPMSAVGKERTQPVI